MQPLTPNERHEAERIKEIFFKNRTDVTIGLFYEEVEQYNYDGELWLKILSMALEHNEQIENEWRNKK